jgi:alginate O-acetyltransferase complex protein AlgI
MLWGLFKKVVIADRLAVYVGAVYDSGEKHHYLNALLATLFFSIQIYCDFSGYSDIAIGAARTMGFDLMINFRRPYFARNIQEFWQRWHISLSSWFRDYVYVPLGGNERGHLRTYWNLVVVFLLSGLWHGANWTFIAWGGLHAALVIVYRLFRGARRLRPQIPLVAALSAIATFSVVTLAWVLFRADTNTDAMRIFRTITTFDRASGFKAILVEQATMREFGATSLFISLFTMTFMGVVEYALPPDLRSLNDRPWTDAAFCVGVLSLVLLLGVFNHTSFIYFQF